MTLDRKTKAALGRAVIRGQVAKAVELQGNRVLELFVDRVRSADVPEFSAEIYQFLLAAHQLTDLLQQHAKPNKKYVEDLDLVNAKHLRNLWEHRHPLKTRLTPKWNLTDPKQIDWLNANYPDNWDGIYVIEVIETEVKIGGILSVNKLVREARYWIETGKDFEGTEIIWFPSDAKGL